MKTLVKLLFATLVMVAISANTFAQSNANADLPSSATVLTALTITKNTNLNFGNVSATTPGIVFLDPQGTANAYVGTNATYGKFTIGGANSQSIKLTWPTEISLTDGATPTPHLLYVATAVSGLDANTQASSGDLTLPCSVNTSTSGAYYLWVGGQLYQTTGTPSALTTATTGTYTGTANFTVTYN